MSAPRRLLKDSGTAFEMALIRSVKGDGPPAGGVEPGDGGRGRVARRGGSERLVRPGMNLARWGR